MVNKIKGWHIILGIIILILILGKGGQRGEIPNLVSCATPKISVSGSDITVEFCIKNAGTIDAPGLIEIQPGMPVQSFISSTQETCDSSFPANVHKDFVLDPGDQKTFTLTTKVYQIGVYNMKAFSYDTCCTSNPNCLPLPPFSNVAPYYKNIGTATVNSLTSAGTCGDKYCQLELKENINTCPGDCPTSYCGDYYCDSSVGETSTNCNIDCKAVICTSGDWQCTNWGPNPCPSNGIQTRVCSTVKDCGVQGKPSESQSCTPGETIRLWEIPVSSIKVPKTIAGSPAISFVIANDQSITSSTKLEVYYVPKSHPWYETAKTSSGQQIGRAILLGKELISPIQACANTMFPNMIKAVEVGPIPSNGEGLFWVDVPAPTFPGEYGLVLDTYTECGGATTEMAFIEGIIVDPTYQLPIKESSCTDLLDEDQKGDSDDIDSDCEGIIPIGSIKPFIKRDEFEEYTLNIPQNIIEKIILNIHIDPLYGVYFDKNYPVCKFDTECPSQSTCIMASSSDRASADKQLVYDILNEYVKTNQYMWSRLLTKWFPGTYEENYGLCVEKKVDPFRQIMDWIKDNPLLAAGLGIGIFVLIIVLMSPQKSGYRRK